MFFTYLESALQYKEFVGGLCNPWNMFLSPLRNVLSFFVYLPIFKGMRAFYGGLVDLLRYSQSLSWRADSNYVKNITVYIDPRVQKISSYKVVKGINLFAPKLIVHRSKNGKQKKNIFINTLNMHISGIIKSEEKLKIVLETWDPLFADYAWKHLIFSFYMGHFSNLKCPRNFDNFQFLSQI